MRVQGEQIGDEGRTGGREVVGGGGGCAWAEDLPVNCAVASRVIGARLSERAWNSTPRGSARVHTLSVQDPCPSVSTRQLCTGVYTKTPKSSHVSSHICLREDEMRSCGKTRAHSWTYRAFNRLFIGGKMWICTNRQTAGFSHYLLMHHDIFISYQSGRV